MRLSNGGGMPLSLSASVSLGSFTRRRRAGTQLSATSASGCPSRFAGGQHVARCLSSVSGSRSGAPGQQASAFHAGWIEHLGFEAGVGDQRLFREQFIGLPVSNRLRSQSRRDEVQFQFKRLSPRAGASVKGGAARGHTAA